MVKISHDSISITNMAENLAPSEGVEVKQVNGVIEISMKPTLVATVMKTWEFYHKILHNSPSITDITKNLAPSNLTVS